jgi:hypothetical protein
VIEIEATKVVLVSPFLAAVLPGRAGRGRLEDVAGALQGPERKLPRRHQARDAAERGASVPS